MKVSENWRPRWWRETHKEKHCGWIISVRVVRMRIRWWFCLINYFFVGWLDVVVFYFDIFCLDIQWFLVMIVHHGLLWFILIHDDSHYGPIMSIHRYPTIAIVDFFFQIHVGYIQFFPSPNSHHVCCINDPNKVMRREQMKMLEWHVSDA